MSSRTRSAAGMPPPALVVDVRRFERDCIGRPGAIVALIGSMPGEIGVRGWVAYTLPPPPSPALLYDIGSGARAG